MEESSSPEDSPQRREEEEEEEDVHVKEEIEEDILSPSRDTLFQQPTHLYRYADMRRTYHPFTEDTVSTFIFCLSFSNHLHNCILISVFWHCGWPGN